MAAGADSERRDHLSDKAIVDQLNLAFNRTCGGPGFEHLENIRYLRHIYMDEYYSNVRSMNFFVY
jgi:hypothetical protein